MSLLDYGPDVVLVYPADTHVDDEYGTPIPTPGDPVTVRCRVQPLFTTDQAGLPTIAIYRIISRDFPPGPHSRVVWSGRDWNIQGEPLRHEGSARTRHVTTHIVAMSPEVA